MSGEDSTNVSELDRLLADCLERIDLGERLDPEALIGQYPQHAAGLRAFFLGNAQLEQVRQTGSTGPRAAQAHSVGEYVSGDEIQGRYRLLQLIGEGGMGAVWLAQQTTPVKRRVAIKLIRAGMDSKLVLARFDAERQALAMMDHPNIARVYDGGMTERGRPFFVMEYLRGTPLTDYCDQARLSIRDRMDLFLQVCRAVQHAHSRGIVHRDLKPSNILVCRYDGRPVTKVIDFGLAKALNHDLTDLTLHTAHGVMVGTPIYMSPEQAELNNLDVDTRTDVYSLGVVLYELLTGTTPLDRERLRRAAMQEVLRLIREEDPIPPSTRLSSSDRLPLIAAQRNVDPSALRHSVTGDLDWIVMKAIEKERARRYETVSVLAEDIQRFLTDDVVQARPPGLFYRISRFARRRRTGLLVAATLAAAVLGTSVGLGWGWKKSSQASTQIQQSISEVQKERGEKQRAQDAAEQQRQVADQLLAEGILRRIGLSGCENSAGGDVSEAETAALRAWAALPDDEQRIRVLETGLSDATTARQLATRSISVLRACVGFSTARRAKVLQVLAEKQRAADCAAEIRGACCLLTAALGGTDLSASADVSSLKLPTHEFEKNVWRILPAVSEAERNRLLRFLLTPRTDGQSAAKSMLNDELEILLDDAIKPSAEMVWQHILKDLQESAAKLMPDSLPVPVPNSELIKPVVKTLPDSAVPQAVEQLLNLIESRPAGVSRDYVRMLLDHGNDLLLIGRLSDRHVAVTAQRLMRELASDADSDRISVCRRYLEILLPKLSAEDNTAICRQLVTILPQAIDWSPGHRWELAGLLGFSARQLPPAALEATAAYAMAMAEMNGQAAVLEMLGPALALMAPLLTQDQVTPLWDSIMRAMPTLEAGEQSDWWQVVMGHPMAMLSGRLDTARAVTAAADLLALSHHTQRPIATMPAVMTALNVLVEHLNPTQLATLKFELTMPLRPEVREQDPELQQTALQYSPSIASLLERTWRQADPADDGSFLHLLQSVSYRDENFSHVAEILTPTLDLVLARTDKAMIPVTFDQLMTSFRQVDWTAGHTSNTATAGSQLLRMTVRHLDAADRPAAWSALLEFFATPGDPHAMLQLREYNFSILVAPALRELALQIPAEQCEAHLQQLTSILNLEIPDTVLSNPQHFSVAMFVGVSDALASKLTAEDARRFITWLNQQSTGVAENIRSFALQAVIPRLDKQQAVTVWDELFAQIAVSGSPEIGAIPFRDLARNLTPNEVQERWQLTLRELQKTSDPVLTGRLCGILMAMVPHVSDELKSAAVDPLGHALQVASQPLQRSRTHFNSPSVYDDRAVLPLKVLSEQLNTEDRRRLAEFGLRLMLEFEPPYSNTLKYQFNLVPISNDPRQIVDFLCHPAASGDMLDQLLRRLEELVLRDGRSLNPHETHTSGFSEQYGMDPDRAKIETVDAWVTRDQKLADGADEFSRPIMQMPPRRRFMTIHDAAEWLEQNWPDFDPDQIAAKMTRDQQRSQTPRTPAATSEL
ncbi:MAG: serine/threonine protein kinase [Planctomyces sp.]